MTVQKQIKLDRTTRDFAAIRQDFIKPGGHLEANYGAEYTEFRESEPGMAMVELVSGVGDVFNYACDRAGNESNIVTARETQSIIELAQSVGYIPASQSPARHKVKFSTAYLPTLTFPAGKILLTNPLYGDQVSFELETPVFKGNGVTEVYGTVIAGRPATQPLIQSTGDGKTRYKLTQPGVIYASVVVKVDGFTWTYVDNFVDSGPGSTHYTLRVEEKIPGQRTTYVVFGNNQNGAYPTLGSVISLSYRVGGGTSSNVPLRAIDRFEEPVTVNGSIISISIENTEMLQLGTNSETRDQIRQNLPVHVVTNQRLVSNEDFDRAVRSLGALRSLTLTNNESPKIWENTVLVYVATSLTLPTPVNNAQALRTQLLSEWPGRNTRRLVVAPCQVLQYTRTVDILVDTGVDPGTVHAAVIQRLTSYLAADSMDAQLRFIVDIGRPIFKSALIERIQPLPGVLSVAVNSDIIPSESELPVTILADWTFNYTVKPYMYG